MNYHNYNSSSRFDMVVEIANIALDEFKTHHITRNYTGLVQRYYQLVEEDYGGRCRRVLGFFDNIVQQSTKLQIHKHDKLP